MEKIYRAVTRLNNEASFMKKQVLGDNAYNKDIIFMDKRTPATIVL